MIRSVSILGSTGSIGRQSLAAAERLGLRIDAVTANRSTKLLEEQIRRYRPRYAAVYDKAAAAALRVSLGDMDIEIGEGLEGLRRAAAMEDTDAVVTAVSGSVGLQPTMDAIRAKKRICLANKETLVCAGGLVMAAAAAQGAQIVPVDSEHSAIFQCLEGRREQLSRILLTGSGGPFRGRSRAETRDVTPEQAVRHPNWSMGAKISVDSATMMNKGLEFIEAMRLFSVRPDQITVLIHPQSVVHSAVEYTDGSVVAQLGIPDMALPIQLAMTWPDRCPTDTAALDLFAMQDLHFEAPDLEAMPCLALAMDAARRGGTAPAILSAANEAAVSLFLQEKLPFGAIAECVAAALDSIEIDDAPTLSEILSADARARNYVMEMR